MPVASGYPGSDAWKDKEKARERADEYKVLGAIIRSLFGSVPEPGKDTYWERILMGFEPETRRLIGRVADLLGPAGKEALQALVEAVKDDTELKQDRTPYEDYY